MPRRSLKTLAIIPDERIIGKIYLIRGEKFTPTPIPVMALL